MNDVEIMHVIQSPSDASQLVRKERHQFERPGDVERVETYQLQSVGHGVCLYIFSEVEMPSKIKCKRERMLFGAIDPDKGNYIFV